MSITSIEIQSTYTNNSNEGCIDSFENSISKKKIKYYEYKHFNNFQKIGSGGFGIVHRAIWKKSKQFFALKSFINFDDVTVKEMFREVLL